jgi:hypothetical protein
MMHTPDTKSTPKEALQGILDTVWTLSGRPFSYITERQADGRLHLHEQGFVQTEQGSVIINIDGPGDSQPEPTTHFLYLFEPTTVPGTETAHVVKFTSNADATDVDITLAETWIFRREDGGDRQLDRTPIDGLWIADQITEALKGKDWYKNLPFARKPTVSHISPSEVARVKDTTGKLTSFADITPMGLANLGLDSVGGETTTDTLMRKLARAISS